MTVQVFISAMLSVCFGCLEGGEESLPPGEYEGRVLVSSGAGADEWGRSVEWNSYGLFLGDEISDMVSTIAHYSTLCCI